jgi:hypothetical protein
MKKLLLAAVAALALSGCILDDEFWEDGYDSDYDRPAGDDCDCDEFSAAHPHSMPSLMPPEMAR